MTEYYNPNVQQNYPDTCAIKSQQLILEDFGIDVSEEALVQTACANGWYNGGGTMPQDVGKLLEVANIPVTQTEGANVFNLINELAQGHEIIVGLDADELWHNDTVEDKFMNWANDFWGPQGGNHALIVMGIDTSNPQNVQVIVKDPGTGEEGKPYPLDQFMDAWADTNCYMVSTNLAAPAFAEGMENFDLEQGHLPEVAGVNFHDFQIFNNVSMGLPTMVPDASGTMVSPIPSLTNAYFDFANDEIDFCDVFNGNYMFNNYINTALVNDYMRTTCFNGIDNINWNSIQPIGFEGDEYFNRNVLAHMDVDYNTFYTDCMNQFMDIGDTSSMELCQQQLDIMDYCLCNNVDYSSDFLTYQL